MFLQLKHKSLHVYAAVRELTKEVYKVSMLLPAEEKFNRVMQSRRAALPLKLNLAEGSTRRSERERNRYIEIASGSVAEIDAAFESAVDLNYLKLEQLQNINELLNKCFAMPSNMII